MSATAEIPLFPLNTVLFPGGPLPLRIFETRYTDMVRRCMREQTGFGVVLIRGAAPEAGQIALTAAVGTLARIVDFNALPDGLLGITCVGERRFRVRRRWRQSDGLNWGEIEWLDDEAGIAVPAEHRPLSALLGKVLPELGELYASMPPSLDDAGWVGARLVEILPLSLSDKQACLEMDDPLARLQRVAPLIRRSDS